MARMKIIFIASAAGVVAEQLLIDFLIINLQPCTHREKELEENSKMLMLMGVTPVSQKSR